MAIYKYLDVSNSHITKIDNDILQASCTSDRFPGCFVYPDRFPGCFVYHCDFGYFISVYSDAPSEEEKKESGLSENFFKILDHARENECPLLRLDADGDILENFEEFEW